jgi:hypothetical protein
MIVPSKLALVETLDELVDRFPLPPVAPPIGDTSLTHVMRLAAHSTTSPTPTAMRQTFIMLLLQLLLKSISFLYFLNALQIISEPPITPPYLLLPTIFLYFNLLAIFIVGIGV